jgi:glycine/D-amino acid oxidase-like deaminating enzyme
MYDGNRLYTEMAVRALSLWREAQVQWKRQVYIESGVLYLFEDADDVATRSIPLMKERGVVIDAIPPGDAAKRFPQISFNDVRTSYFEPNAGVLLARLSCELVRETFEQEGGEYRRAGVRAPAVNGGRRLRAIEMEATEGPDRPPEGGHHVSATRLEADAFVFACGAWLGTLFPDVVGDGIVATRQEVLYVGTPAGNRKFDAASFPGWINFGAGRWYGMPGAAPRGVKVADDVAGPPVDPTSMDRVVSIESVKRARAFVRRRFPELANQPIVETRVCQYEYSPNADFLIDRHPAADNVWLVGGGSGHGFKMGPALGEYVARLVLEGAAPDAQFSYPRFADARERLGPVGGRKIHW